MREWLTNLRLMGRKGRLLRPSRAFVARARIRYLSAYQERYPQAHPQAVPVFRYFSRGLVVGVAVAVLVGGASTYAEQKNVDPTSPLYPLKRSSEAIQLVLTTTAERPALHAKLAERRLGEAEAIRAADPSSLRTAALAVEFRDEMLQSLETMNQIELTSAAMTGNGMVGDEPQAFPILVPTTSRESLQTDADRNTTAIPAQIRREKERGEAKAARHRLSVQKMEKVCRSLTRLLVSDVPEARDLLGQDGAILKQFNKNCEPLLNLP